MPSFFRSLLLIWLTAGFSQATSPPIHPSPPVHFSNCPPPGTKIHGDLALGPSFCSLKKVKVSGNVIKYGGRLSVVGAVIKGTVKFAKPGGLFIIGSKTVVRGVEHKFYGKVVVKKKARVGTLDLERVTLELDDSVIKGDVTCEGCKDVLISGPEKVPHGHFANHISGDVYINKAKTAVRVESSAIAGSLTILQTSGSVLVRKNDLLGGAKIFKSHGNVSVIRNMVRKTKSLQVLLTKGKVRVERNRGFGKGNTLLCRGYAALHASKNQFANNKCPE